MIKISTITIKNANVNSGTAVTIEGHITSYGMKRMIKGDPVAGYYDTSDTTMWNIVAQDRGGVENPIIIVNGLLDINDTAAANEMTELLLRKFWRERQNPCYLKVTIGASSYQVRDYAGAQGVNGLKVEILSITQTFDTSSDKDHFINYQVSLRKTA